MHSHCIQVLLSSPVLSLHAQRYQAAAPFHSLECMHGLCIMYICAQAGSNVSLSFQCDEKLNRNRSPPFGRMALDGIRMPDGCYADGTWELKMHVTDLHRDVSLRVTGEIHIGGVMLKLVEKLGTCARC